MLTLVTHIGIVRIPLLQLRRAIPILPERVSTSPSYGSVIELKAAAKGEAYSSYPTEGIHPQAIEESFSFACSNGKVTLPYRKETLARHSLLIKGFIEDFPEATEIEATRLNALSVSGYFATIFNDPGPVELSPEMIETIQILTPPTDLYYFLFYLPTDLDQSFLLSLLAGITDDERSDILVAHHAVEREAENEEGYEMSIAVPDQGRGIAIAFAIPSVAEYLRRVRVPEIHGPYPSFTFYTMVNYGCYEAFEKEGSYFLLETTFDDNDVLFLRSNKDFAITEMLGHLKVLDWDQCCVVLAMLGVRHPALGNEDVDRMAPYQLVLEENIVEAYVWNGIRHRLCEIAKVPMELIDGLMEPYLK